MKARAPRIQKILFSVGKAIWQSEAKHWLLSFSCIPGLNSSNEPWPSFTLEGCSKRETTVKRFKNIIPSTQIFPPLIVLKELHVFLYRHLQLLCNKGANCLLGTSALTFPSYLECDPHPFLIPLSAFLRSLMLALQKVFPDHSVSNECSLNTLHSLPPNLCGPYCYLTYHLLIGWFCLLPLECQILEWELHCVLLTVVSLRQFAPLLHGLFCIY